MKSNYHSMLALYLTVMPALIAPTPALGQNTGDKAPTRVSQLDPAQLDQIATTRAETIGKEVGLTAEQITQLAKLNSTAMRQAQKLFNTKPKDKEPARQKLLDVLVARQKALDKLLTADQRPKYNAVATRDIAAIQSEIIARKLDLNDIQVKQLNTVNQEIINKLRAALTISDKQKRMNAIRDIQTWKDEMYRGVLTSKQYDDLIQMRQYMTPTNADTRISTSDGQKGDDSANPYGPYASSYPLNPPQTPVGKIQQPISYGFGNWGNSVVYPTVWTW